MKKKLRSHDPHTVFNLFQKKIDLVGLSVNPQYQCLLDLKIEQYVYDEQKKLMRVHFWHRLHRLIIKELKNLPGWPFTRIEKIFSRMVFHQQKRIFSEIHMWHFDTDFTDLQKSFREG